MKPYPDPAPRNFDEWCADLGLESEGKLWPADQIMTYEQFCFLSDTRLRKVREGALYGFWKQYGDVYGEPRTVQEWLDDTGQHIVKPIKEDLEDLNLFLGHDEFWSWAGGKVEQNTNTNTDNWNSFFISLKKLFTHK